jgi:hypothetical protein
MHAARAFLGIGDRFRSEQRALERLDRVDPGLARSNSHGDANAATGEFPAAVGQDPSLLHELIDRARAGDDEIGGLALLDARKHDLGRVIAHRDFAPARTLELRDQLAHHSADAVGSEYLDGACHRDYGTS